MLESEVHSTTSLGFIESDADPCVLVCMSKKKKVEIVAVYVDDLILITETPDGMQHIKESLSTIFKMKDLVELHYCLGVNFHVDEKTTYLCKVSTMNDYWTSMGSQKLTKCLPL